LEDHAIRPFYLPIGARVSCRCLFDLDPVPINEIEELLAREVGPTIRDDGVGHTKPVDDVKKKLDSFLGAGLDDRFCLNPFGELVHRNEQVGEATRSLL
jgi:hypothetical protein